MPQFGHILNIFDAKSSVAFIMFFIRVGLANARMSVCKTTSSDGELIMPHETASSNDCQVLMPLIKVLLIPAGLAIKKCSGNPILLANSIASSIP
jgi:hypothetical protein